MNINKLAVKFEKLKDGFNKHSYLQITDNREVIAEGCRKIIVCDENVIKLKMTENTLIVAGDRLKMRNYTGDGVIIKGVIQSLAFESTGENEYEQ